MHNNFSFIIQSLFPSAIRDARMALASGDYMRALSCYRAASQRLHTSSFKLYRAICLKQWHSSGHVTSPSASEVKRAFSNALKDIPASVKPRVISLLDEFSYNCFKHCFDLDPLNINAWRHQLNSGGYSFLLAESCWRANQGTWSHCMTSSRHPNRTALVAALGLAQSKGITTVFWNKEDPVNYDKFKDVAGLFDIVFTTDADSVSRYAHITSRVAPAVLPFAASSVLHHPITAGARNKRLFFAGSWSANKYPHRGRWLDTLLAPLMERGLVDIYDRYHEDSGSLSFPARFRTALKGAVSHDLIADKVYRPYSAAINVNSVESSPTMLARRVYELAACGTPILSSPCAALHGELLSFVTIARTREEVVSFADTLLSEDIHERLRILRIQARGVRFAHSSNTYQDRAQTICNAAGLPNTAGRDPRSVTAIVVSKRPEMLFKTLMMLKGQTKRPTRVIVVLHGISHCATRLYNEFSRFMQLTLLPMDDVNACLADGLNLARRYVTTALVAKVDDDDIYGPHYMEDSTLAFGYSDATLVGKRAHFVHTISNHTTALRFPEQSYARTSFVHGATMVWRHDPTRTIAFEPVRQGTDTLFQKAIRARGGTILSLDPFGFVHMRYTEAAHHTWRIEDSSILTGADVVSHKPLSEHVYNA